MTSPVFKSEIDKVIKIAEQRLQYIEGDFKSENLFRTSSVALSLATSFEFHSNPLS